MNNDQLKPKADESKEEVPRKIFPFVFYLLRIIVSKKKYWLVPFWILLLTIALLLFLTGNGAMLPAIYLAI